MRVSFRKYLSAVKVSLHCCESKRQPSDLPIAGCRRKCLPRLLISVSFFFELSSHAQAMNATTEMATMYQAGAMGVARRL